MEREQERWRLAEALTEQFVQRKDLYAIQLKDGRSVSVRKRCTPGIMYLHLTGQITIGAYLLDEQNQTRQLVLDADDDETFEKIKQLAWSLNSQDIPAYLETSRRGGHLRLFFDQAISGQMARRLGLKLLHDHQLSIELYPKQEALADGPGSLVRVPFGIHRVTGKRYGFIYPDGRPTGTMREQVEALAHPQTVPLEFVKDNQYEPPARRKVQPKTFSTRSGQGETVWERIKDSISVYDFVSQYVELHPTGNGYMGRCPFHDDHHPPFGVNHQRNYWNCFTGCGGGSIVDFWMTMQGIDFKTAVSQLEVMLLHDTMSRST